MIAAFHGGHKNLHQVDIVKKSARYTIGSFWDDREESDYSEETRKEWADEMQKIRDAQKVEKEDWQNILKEGYKIDELGNKYKIEELD